MRDAISSAVETALPWIEAAQRQLEVGIPDMSLVLNADPTRLAQILNNLLTNVSKYTPNGEKLGCRYKKKIMSL